MASAAMMASSNKRSFYNIYDASSTLVHVADLNSLDGGTIEYTDSVRAEGMEFTQVIGGRGYNYPSVDALGSPVAMTNSMGVVTSRSS